VGAVVERAFAELKLSRAEAARLLGVDERTVRRWLTGDAVPGPVLQVLAAWRTLARHGLNWRPDAVSIFEEDTRAIKAHADHAIEQAAMLEKVKARGGPRTPWDVDIDQNTATLGGKIVVSFHRLQNGNFSLYSYRRTDINPDLLRDREMIEDAAASIAEAIAKI
jgi:hypothetical protein